MQPSLRLLDALPTPLKGAKTDIWDDSPLWDQSSAAMDFSRIFSIGYIDDKTNTFILKRRSFPGNGVWEYLGNFPAHYHQHILLCSYMHAWCRDLLVLGRWDMLDNVSGEVTGSEVKENSMRLMRYLSRVRDEFLLAIKDHRLRHGDGQFPLDLRVPTFDLHLLALYHHCQFSQDAYEEVLTNKQECLAFQNDPILLSEVQTSCRKIAHSVL
jgi:hypothetical protein